MHGFGDGLHDMDVFTPDGADLGHIVHHGADTTLTDAIGDSQLLLEATNGIDQILDAHGQALGFVDHNSEISMHDGTLGHMETDPFGNTHVINDLHPMDQVVITHAPFGGAAIVDPDGVPLAFAKEHFGV